MRTQIYSRRILSNMQECAYSSQSIECCTILLKSHGRLSRVGLYTLYCSIYVCTCVCVYRVCRVVTSRRRTRMCAFRSDLDSFNRFSTGASGIEQNNHGCNARFVRVTVLVILRRFDFVNLFTKLYVWPAIRMKYRSIKRIM